MRPVVTRGCALALAALALAGCVRAQDRADRRESRRDERAEQPAAVTSPAALAAGGQQVDDWEADLEDLERELDEIDALLTED